MGISDFCHLHIHDKYSVLDGMGSCSDYIEKAKELRMTALSQTNHGNVFGSFKFWKACRAAKIKPILGEEFYIVGDRFKKEDRTMWHLILLAKNIVGWKNICKLSSLASIEGKYYKPRADVELIKKYSEGLICLSACMAGEVGQSILSKDELWLNKTIDWYENVFGEDYYLEIQPHQDEDQKKVNRKLLSLGKRLVATNDAHYVNKEDEKYHKYLLKIQTGGRKDSTFEFGIKNLHLKSRFEIMNELLNYHEFTEKQANDACNVTLEIESKIEQIEFDFGYKIPVYQ